MQSTAQQQKRSFTRLELQEMIDNYRLKTLDHSTKNIRVVELDRMTDVQKDEYERNLVLFKLWFLCGFRVSEIVSLRKENFDFNVDPNLEIAIIKNVENKKQRKGSRYAIKNNIILDYNDSWVRDIRVYINHLETSCLFPKRLVIFGWVYKIIDEPMTTRSFMNIVKGLSPDLKTHDFRRSAINHLINFVGVNDVFALMSYTSHSNINSINSYLHLQPLYTEKLLKANKKKKE